MHSCVGWVTYDGGRKAEGGENQWREAFLLTYEHRSVWGDCLSVLKVWPVGLGRSVSDSTCRAEGSYPAHWRRRRGPNWRDVEPKWLFSEEKWCLIRYQIVDNGHRFTGNCISSIHSLYSAIFRSLHCLSSVRSAKLLKETSPVIDVLLQKRVSGRYYWPKSIYFRAWIEKKL